MSIPNSKNIFMPVTVHTSSHTAGIKGAPTAIKGTEK